MLLFSAFMVGALHALAPDHWVPFAALSKARNWSARKAALITFLSGIVHVASSLAIGLAGIFLQKSLADVTSWEGLRGEWFSVLLISFGLTYMLWNIKQSNKKKTEAMDPRQDEVAYWSYFAIFVLGPCEPLIPFLFLSTENGAAQMIPVVLCFSAATLAVMSAAAFLAVSTMDRIKLPGSFVLNPGAAAGATIAVTGLVVRILGI